jgi:hypothetical protein
MSKRYKFVVDESQHHMLARFSMLCFIAYFYRLYGVFDISCLYAATWFVYRKSLNTITRIAVEVAL